MSAESIKSRQRRRLALAGLISVTIAATSWRGLTVRAEKEQRLNLGRLTVIPFQMALSASN
jgi:hypothetical protein